MASTMATQKPNPESISNPLRIDPTRLHGVRQKALLGLHGRYQRILKQIQQKIIDEHFLEVGVGETPIISDGNLNLDFDNSEDQLNYDVNKVDEFESWLNGLAVELSDEVFVTEYVERAYKQGRKRAYTDSRKSKLKPQPNVVITNAADFQEGGKESFMQGGETSPTSKKTKQSLISQAMAQLKGLAGQMVQVVKQIILMGIRKFWTPKQIAKAIRDEIDKYERRSEVAIKDDITRAHGESQLDAYAELGHLVVMAIIETAQDDRVCAKCRVLEGREVPIEQARGLLPVHCNCRCAWKPLPPRLVLSDAEKDKRKNETTRETIERLQQDLVKLQEDEKKAAEKLTARPGDMKLREVAEKAELNRLKLEVQILERRAAQIRVAVEHTRHLANDFIRSQAVFQKKLESKQVDNDGHSDTGFAKYVIDRERLVERARDAIMDLPDVDDYLKEADTAYNKERNRRLRRHQEIQEDADFEIDIEITVLREYLDKLSIFAQDSELVLLTRKAVRLIPQLIADADRLRASYSEPVQEFSHKKPTPDEIQKTIVSPVWQTFDKKEQKGVTVYAQYSYASSMNGIGRREPLEDIRDVLENVRSGNVTEDDIKKFSQYNCVGKDGEPDMDWKEVIENVANLQRAAAKYKTTEPLVMYRYVETFDYLKSPKIGQIITFNGFTSLFGSLQSKLKIDGKEVKSTNMEFRIPVGTPIIPIGSKAKEPEAIEFLLPHGTSVKVLAFRESYDPYIVLEVIPESVEFFDKKT
jgi:SPP1 gp7 family putative phage head morphogenesis protein